MDDPRPVTLLVADDHPLILAGLAALIRAEPALALVGEAGDAIDAVEEYLRLRPDVMLIDLNMPGGGGVEAIRKIRALVPDARIVILTTYDGDEDVHRGLLAGASAYLLKQSGLDEVLHCVRQVAANRRYLAPGLAEKLAGRVAANRLSRRELEILAHLAAGMSNKVIARAENIGVGTVKYHVNNILSKLGVSCRTEAACVAARRGLIHTYREAARPLGTSGSKHNKPDSCPAPLVAPCRNLVQSAAIPCPGNTPHEPTQRHADPRPDRG